MKKTLLTLALTATLIITGTTSSATDQSDTNRSNALCSHLLDKSQSGFDAAFTARDAHKLTSFYHPNATLINPFGAIRDTTSEIEGAFTGLFSSPFLSTVTLVRREVEGCRTAVVVSDFLLEDPSDNSKLHFLASLTWTFENGRWRVLMDQSTNLPVN